MCVHVCAMCVHGRVPLAWQDGITPRCPRLPVWLGLFPSTLLTIFFLCVSLLFLSLPEREQAMVQKLSNYINLPTLLPSCLPSPLPVAVPGGPAAWSSQRGLVCRPGTLPGSSVRLTCHTLVLPILGAGCCHIVIPSTLDTIQHLPEVLLLFPSYK